MPGAPGRIRLPRFRAHWGIRFPYRGSHRFMPAPQSFPELRPFGSAWSATEAWQPPGALLGEGERAPWARPKARALGELGRLWPAREGARLEARALDGFLEELRSGDGARRLWSALGYPPNQDWAGWEAFEAACRAPLSEGADGGRAASGLLVANDWRAEFPGAWVAWIRALQAGRPSVVLVSEVLPEGFGVLFEALLAAGGPSDLVCPLIGQREGLVRAVLDTDRIGEVQVAGPRQDAARWQALVGANHPAGSARVPSNPPFGFGVDLPRAAPALHYCVLSKPTLHKAESSDPKIWVREALQTSLGLGPALGGWSASAPGAWVLPARQFSVVTETLLQALEGDSLGPAFPILDPGHRDSLAAVRNLALGKGAALLHSPAISTPSGVCATLACQIFTNVGSETAHSMAAWMTPSLALCRGEWTLGTPT